MERALLLLVLGLVAGLALRPTPTQALPPLSASCVVSVAPSPAPAPACSCLCPRILSE